jgi:hypothetical protein
VENAQFTPSIFNLNDGLPRIKLLCGADLLGSFAKPGLWKPEDVSIFGVLF